MYLGFEYQALRVHEQVEFSALHFLVTVVSSLLSSHAGALDRLGIYYAGARLRISPHTDSHPLA